MSPVESIETLFIPEVDAATLQAPPADLLAQVERRLSKTEFLHRAAASGLYQSRWRAAGVVPGKSDGRAELRRFPFIDSADLVAMNASGPAIAKALRARPRTWVASRGRSGARKWLPLTNADIVRFFARMCRAAAIFGRAVEPGSVALAINQPLPYVSNALPFWWERADYFLGGRRLEFIIGALSMMSRTRWDLMAQRKRPQWLAGSVDDALEFARSTDAAVTLPSLRRGVFWGSPLDGPEGARTALTEACGLEETFSLYLSAECREMYVECAAHDGVHIWLDDAIHEIIPVGSESKDNGPTQTVFLDQAPVGTVGEYVVTTFAEALPLIHYRTGDRVRVVATGRCSCGITHPRVRFEGAI